MTTTVAAEMAEGARHLDSHPAASATRLRLSVDPTHLTVKVPQILRATEGGPPVEWYVRVRNAAGRLTRSDLRIAISLAPGETGQSMRQVHWSINREGRWTDLTGQTHVETDEFELKPGESRTVRIRLALPTDAKQSKSDDVGAALWAAVRPLGGRPIRSSRRGSRTTRSPRTFSSDADLRRQPFLKTEREKFL
ncbi:hypothetical protein SALBM311S_11647 [Streptomyces alboniger]